MKNIITVVAGLLFLFASEVRSQENRLDVAAILATTFQHELDSTDLGFGGRIGFQATPLFAIEAEMSFYPSNIPEGVPVTESRLEGLFGVKIGPRYDRFSVFGKARPGFVRFSSAPEPIACIAIFPPPLNCVLARGETVLALDLGGGVELYPTERTLVRIDVSSLLLRYPGPAMTRDREAVAEDAFWGGNLKLTFSAGLRF